MKKHSSKSNTKESVWQIQEAKAKFSQLIEDANEKGYQTITKQGKPVAVILSKKEFDRVIQAKDSLLKFFKAAPCQDIELDIQRLQDLPRDLDL